MLTTATSSTYGTMLGNDNWIVNFGGQNSNIPSATKTQTTTVDDRQSLGQAPADPYVDGGLGGGSLGITTGGTPGLLLLAVGGLVLLRMLRKRHG